MLLAKRPSALLRPTVIRPTAASRTALRVQMVHYTYAVLGGGTAAGYCAREFVAQGVKPGELVIIGEEKVVGYERPALSKAYLAPEKPARLPGFHTCVGGGGERQDEAWYKDKGITYMTGTTVSSVSLKDKTLNVAKQEPITYDKLIIATGSKTSSLVGKTPGAELGGIHYLRNVQDADALLVALAATKAKGGKAVFVGGGYISMEVSSNVCAHGVPTTLVMPEDRLMARLFTHEIAAFYEKFYTDKGITLLKEAKVKAFEGTDGKVTHVVVEVGGKETRLEADLVVAGIGAQPNVELFEGQLTLEQGGVRVDGHLQSSVAGVYAVGDVALYPLKMKGGDLVRQEHVINARQTASHAVKAIYGATDDYDYLPSFYSRIFSLSWVFYGRNVGEAVHFVSHQAGKIGAYFIEDGKIVGAFLEGGSAEEQEQMKKVARAMPAAPSDRAGLAAGAFEFAAKLVASQ